MRHGQIIGIAIILPIAASILSATATAQVTGRSKTGSFSEPSVPAVKDQAPPEIELVEPVALTSRGLQVKKNDALVTTKYSSLKFRGIARDDGGVAMVLVNNHEAMLSIAKDGTEFVGEALLALGRNEVEIKAVDRFANANTLTVPVMREQSTALTDKGARVGKGQRWAVVVGISDYKSTSIPDLRYADQDARAFYELLALPLEDGGVGLPKPNIRLLTNSQATSANVREALTDFLKNAIEEDMVIIYFAGHGAPDPDRPKVLYLLTYDSDLDRIAATSIKMQEVQDALRDYVAAQTVLVFADACHSRGVSGGAATRGLASPQLVNEFLSDLGRSRPSTLTLSASDVDQLSQEDKKWGGGHGVFTYHLIEGFRGKADSDKDKIVRLGELIFYVNEKVRRDTKAQQSPICSGAFDVNLPLTIVP
jgi:hypothetical protein